MNNNHLKSVFWDYPHLQAEGKVKELILSKEKSSFEWVLYRFLEYARVIDTFNFFSIDEIKDNIDKLKLKDETRKKWNRLIQVYGRS
jgi:hypothetical protein